MRIVNDSTGYLKPVSFGRKPSQAEFKVYSKTIKEGLRVLNKDFGLIIHNSSLPSAKGHNTGIGSLLSKASASLFIPFLASQGITKIQQEPTYLRRLFDPSPYDPISTAKNVYMAPLEKLATEEYSYILSPKTLNEIEQRNELTEKSDKVNYQKINGQYSYAFYEAYDNFINNNINPSLKQEFEVFKINKRAELEPFAIYEIITGNYGDEDWKNWKDKDKYLYDSPENLDYLNKIRELDADRIDFYLFKQWIVEREIEKSNKQMKDYGIRVIADTPIAFAPAEEWLNKDLFLNDLSLGCPPDFFSSEGQRWGFAVLDPEKIFNEDGSLGKGGEFLKKRYEEIFKASPGGVRIDHLIGLIDPFVYKESEPHMNHMNSGRLYSSPNNEILKKYTKTSIEDYASVFEKIIIPAANKYGLSQEDILCEDLGEKTNPVWKVMEKLGLSGLWLTQFGYNGADAPKDAVIMMGAHDNKSFLEYIDDFFYNSAWGDGRNNFMRKTHTLAADTLVPNQDENSYRESLRNSKKEFLKASFAELFTSPAKKVQMFFTDFFGIKKTYNVPGSKKDCWTLRLPDNWEELYYKNLKNETALNIPEALATAIRHKGEKFASKYKPLLNSLDRFTKILKE